MNGEEELERIIERMVKQVIAEKKRRGGRPGPGWPNGVYLYDGREWRLYRDEGDPYSIGENGDGVYMVYFDNTRCPACRMYDPEWYSFAEENWREGVFFVVVLCDWFSRNCNSTSASMSFLKYRVKASPTTIIASTRAGELLYNNRIEGVVGRDRLGVELSIARALYIGGGSGA